MLRRLSGLLLSSLVLQLNFRASDLVCAQHDWGQTSGAEMSSAQHHGMAMTVHSEQQIASEQQSCEIPATKDCCVALVSCSMTFGLGETTHVGNSARGQPQVSVLAAEAPASVIRSPEPPPPRG